MTVEIQGGIEIVIINPSVDLQEWNPEEVWMLTGGCWLSNLLSLNNKYEEYEVGFFTCPWRNYSNKVFPSCIWSRLSHFMRRTCVCVCACVHFNVIWIDMCKYNTCGTKYQKQNDMNIEVYLHSILYKTYVYTTVAIWHICIHNIKCWHTLVQTMYYTQHNLLYNKQDTCIYKHSLRINTCKCCSAKTLIIPATCTQGVYQWKSCIL